MSHLPGVKEKILSLTNKTYGKRKLPVEKEFMSKEELIAISPLGSTQTTEVSRRLATYRESLPPVIKRALKYLYPAKKHSEQPPVSKYDSMVRKMSNYSILKDNENKTVLNESYFPSKKGKKFNVKLPLSKKLSGIFDFPESKTQRVITHLSKQRSKSELKLPSIKKVSYDGRYSSVDYIDCISYTGQAESEYLKTYDAQKEYRKVYDLMLIESGLYSHLRVRNENGIKVKYRRMPV